MLIILVHLLSALYYGEVCTLKMETTLLTTPLFRGGEREGKVTFNGCML